MSLSIMGSHGRVERKGDVIAFVILREKLGCFVKSGWFWGQSGHQKIREEAFASTQAGGMVMGIRPVVVMGQRTPGGHLTMPQDSGTTQGVHPALNLSDSSLVAIVEKAQ